MIFNIAICDDEYIHRKVLLGYLSKVFFNEPYEVLEFSSGEDLLASYPKKLDILLLDINMIGINGIETARKIRVFDTDVMIIFTTAISSFMQEGYEVMAFRYLLKPINYNEFSRHLIKCKNYILSNKEKCISIKDIDEGEIVIITIKSILYVEMESRITLIHTDEKVYRTRESIKNFEKKLKEYSFYRCHRAYLINLREISSIGKNSVFIKNDEIFVSRYKIKELKAKISDMVSNFI